MSEPKITGLYDHFKNTPKKLKIICGWDEVIQPHEPYALWLALKQNRKLKDRFDFTFEEFFKEFWQKDYASPIDYSPYGSSLNTPKFHKLWDDNLDEVANEQIKVKTSPNLYQIQPFLTIAEDLLKLIKEDKVEDLVFLTANDDRIFPMGDNRKKEIFNETFGKLGKYLGSLEIRLVPFGIEGKEQTKTDLIKKKYSDFDIVIDDNPNICKSLVENGCFIVDTNKPCLKPAKDYFKTHSGKGLVCEGHLNIIPIFNENWDEICSECGKLVIMDEAGAKIGAGGKTYHPNCYTSYKIKLEIIGKDDRNYGIKPTPMTICSPHYPARENQHDKRVLLVKNEVSDLKKEDFIK